MTNLLAAIVISLSTNVTVEDNRPTRFVPEPCPDAAKQTGPFYSNCLVNHGRWEKYGEATEKIEFETVTRSRVLQFSFLGKLYDVPVKEQPVIISHRVRVSNRETQWKVTEDYKTNAPTPAIAWTNNPPTNILRDILYLVITNNGPSELWFTPR